MARYVDGFVLPVPKEHVEAYRTLAQQAGELWREHGALEYVECVADDLESGAPTSFVQILQLKPDETAVFAWITYESREHRDRVNEQVMKDPRLQHDPANMPFDLKRMVWAGFRAIVEL